MRGSSGASVGIPWGTSSAQGLMTIQGTHPILNRLYMYRFTVTWTHACIPLPHSLPTFLPHSFPSLLSPPSLPPSSSSFLFLHTVSFGAETDLERSSRISIIRSVTLLLLRKWVRTSQTHSCTSCNATLYLNFCTCILHTLIFGFSLTEANSYSFPGMGVGVRGSSTAITLPPPSSHQVNDAVTLPPPHWQRGPPFQPKPQEAAQNNEQHGVGLSPRVDVPVLGADIIKETFSGT